MCGDNVVCGIMVGSVCGGIMWRMELWLGLCVGE